ncbi:uncharacterized protein BXZ73DRAFT_105509 [Epithele typhae]|uniref:uncharacterized protein n=1 Tax=Epithele typhae TaxID=378194 RepID=UPI0020081B72|nr:uncharacterized protein BXZ73DRAFT_105509 [Epithele typhae]KAH9917685.1 hypothetical protein BXZ73DRAFT_105509 [Epithele typhae]
MPDIYVANAQLLGVFCEVFTTGIYFAYLPRCVSIWRRKRRQELPLWLPIAGFVIFLLATANFFTEMVIGYAAFGIRPGETRPDPTTFFADVSSPTSLTKGVLTALLAMVSDFIIVFRAWVIWDYNLWVISLPVGLLVTTWALGVWALWTEFETGIQHTDIMLAEVSVRVRYFFITTFVLNILCASLICWKVWCVVRQTAPILGKNRPSKVLAIVVETASIYCALLLALIISDSVGSNIFFTFLGMLPGITAIVFTVLIVRASNVVRASQANTRSISLHISAVLPHTLHSTVDPHPTSHGAPPRLASEVLADLERMPSESESETESDLGSDQVEKSPV